MTNDSIIDYYAVSFNPSDANGGVSGYFYFTDLEDAQKSYSQEVRNFGDECTVELVKLRNDAVNTFGQRFNLPDLTSNEENFFEFISFEDLFSSRVLFDLIHLHVPDSAEPEIVLPYLSQGRISGDVAEQIGMPDVEGFVNYEDSVPFDTLVSGQPFLGGEMTPMEVIGSDIRVKCRVHIAEFVDDWSHDMNRQVLLGF